MGFVFNLKRAFLLSAGLCVGFVEAAFAEESDLMSMSVEELLNIEVTSVAKKAKALNDSPAAIYVITQEDIRRIGATSIPEALRLAPGIDVARIDANKWAISARGFNGRFANKLLVMIDGRNLYTRTFSGVYWENQDVVMDDIERIEVIRGPGATLWGANAVNGVINIITKHSSDTQGGMLVAGGGTEEQAFGSLRYGGRLSDDTTARAYVKGFKRDEYTFSSGGEAGDDWDKVQGGFRFDSQYTLKDSLTLQGDMYYSHFNQNSTLAQLAPPYQTNFNERINSYGGNILARQQHSFSSTSDYSLQLFYDFYERDEVYFSEARHTLDLDFQHRFALLDWHEVVWGFGYRYSHDETSANQYVSMTPRSRNDQLVSGFIQDEITLVDDRLWLTVGSKFEHNDYSGFEGQPTARLMWAPHHQHRIWTAVSRAVRTPARYEQDMSLLLGVFPVNPFVSTIVTLDGNKHFDSEEVISYEIGYRTSVIENVSFDVTAFYNDYRNIRSIRLAPPAVVGTTVYQSLEFVNDIDMYTYGFEVATVWQMLDWWRWDVNYSLLKTQFDDHDQAGQIAMSPQQRFSLRSSQSLMQNVDLDFLFRYVDSNHVQGLLFGSDVIKDYVSLDIRLAWRPVDDIELALVGQNLLDAHHLEYRQENLTRPTEIDRGMYGRLSWRF